MTIWVVRANLHTLTRAPSLAKFSFAVDTITDAVIEGTNLGAAKLALRGLHKTCVILDFTEVPTFTVHMDLFAIERRFIGSVRIQRLLDGQQVRSAVVAHEVEAETRDFVIPCPCHDRVNH